MTSSLRKPSRSRSTGNPQESLGNPRRNQSETYWKTKNPVLAIRTSVKVCHISIREQKTIWVCSKIMDSKSNPTIYIHMPTTTHIIYIPRIFRSMIFINQNGDRMGYMIWNMTKNMRYLGPKNLGQVVWVFSATNIMLGMVLKNMMNCLCTMTCDVVYANISWLDVGKNAVRSVVYGLYGLTMLSMVKTC